ncbi:cache domain-containing protein [Desulfomonile tiedjei]|uniref:Cache domain protein n=1 Tax=Desulfomonile tiedjei (strain ATCC 49306 / DSM 6799 / DCB-1) TaxID=706587 RepID=I4C0V6_DESTA|nr:cache domain-containing protein [Desulfomonile tiedjei]AFM23197.1 Cache domain protein [Desulfomonile tiedjei DSM 6799]
MKFFTFGITFVLCVVCIGVVTADDAADVKALVEKGVVLVKENGRDAAIKVINNPKSQFVKGDVYLFAGSLDNVTMLAHPFAPQLLGVDLTALKDPKGNPFFVKFKQVAETSGSGWVEYTSVIAGTEGALKKAFIMRVPGEQMYIGGAYYPK